MIPLVTYILIYLLGGLTLLPGVLLYVWYAYIAKRKKQQSVALHFPSESYTVIDEYQSKKGWIRIVECSPSPPTFVKKSSSFTKTMVAMTTSKSGNPDKSTFHKNATHNSAPFSPSSSTLLYAILRHGTLFCFDNEQEKICHLILPMHNYSISLYPKEGKREAELFGRLMSISLTPKNNPASSSTYYLSCRRPTDKEDWYFAMTAASQILPQQNRPSEWKDSAMYDTFAMTRLRSLLDGTPAQVETQCWNAMMGRIFLGIYKTEHWKQIWHTKMKNKLTRMNTPSPLEQLQQKDTDTKHSMIRLAPFQLQFISMGDTIPCLTNTKLVEFGSDGNCVIHGHVHYDGTILVVIRTDFHYLWPALASTFENKKPNDSPPGSLPLVLSIKLRHCSGKVVFKVKPPPSGRIWAGFESMPHMEWDVTPVVMDTQVKWSLVINHIQAKLKEMVAESLVLPNMEDFPFFDSDGLGGIFGDRSDESIVPAAQEQDGGDIIVTEEKDDSAINVDLANENVDVVVDNQEKEPPRVSKLVQGYMNRIKNPHLFPSSLHTRSPNATKV